MEFHAIVLAAGKGSRIPELTSDIPKPLLPLANKPMIWYPLRMLEEAGFEQAMVVVLKSQMTDIQQAVTKIHKIKMQLHFVPVDDDCNWGTADTLRHLLDRITNDVVMVSCDFVSSLPLHLLVDVHRTNNSSLTMLLADLPDIAKTTAPGKSKRKQEKDIIGLDKSTGHVLFFGSVADYEETVTFKKAFLKRHPHMTIHTQLLDGHIYLIKRAVLDTLKEHSSSSVKGELIPYLVKQQFAPPRIKQEPQSSPEQFNRTDGHLGNGVGGTDLTTVARGLSVSGLYDESPLSTSGQAVESFRCFAYRQTDGLCLRTNNLPSYCEANKLLPQYLLKMYPSLDTPAVHPSVIMPSKKSQVGTNSMVGENTALQERVSIKQSIVGPHCNIGEKVRITNSIIMDHVVIKDGCNISGCLIASNTSVENDCELKDCLIGKEQVIAGSATSEILVKNDQWMEI